MCKMFLVAMMAMLVVASAAMAEDSGLVPVQSVAGGKLKLSGFAQAVIDDVGNAQANVDSPNCRLRAVYERGWLKLGAEIDAAQFDEEQSNWLREVWLGTKITDQLELRLGRVFLASGYATPPAFLLETVKYPQAAFYSCYGWGLQLNYASKKWEARLDLTDGSGSSFPKGDQERTLTCSGRLQRKFDAGSLAATFQYSQDWWRWSLGAEASLAQSLTLRGLVSYEHSSDYCTSNRFGMYLLAAYRPEKADWFEFHAQADYVQRLAKEWVEYQHVKNDDGTISVKRVEMESDGSSDTTITLGTRFFAGKDDCLSLTVDCQIPLAAEKANLDPKILGRFQFRF